MRFGLGLGLQRLAAAASAGPPSGPSSLLLDGVNKYVTIPGGYTKLTTESFTITGWYKPNETVTNNRIVFGDSVNAFYYERQTASTGVMRNRYNSTNAPSGTPAAANGTWNHFALVVPATGMGQYRWLHNGVLVNGSTGAKAIYLIDKFGARNASPSNFWKGNLAEWQTWNRDLTNAEVAQLVSAGAYVDPATLSFASDMEHRWKFGAGDSQSQIQDLIGSLHLTPVNITNADFVSDHP